MKIKFGTDGFRGVIGKDFTFETALNAGMMALRHFGKKTGNSVAVGYDTRFLSEDVAAEMADMAAVAGYDTSLATSFCPSPALSLYTNKKKMSCGLMITASHNPARFNGVKIKENFGGSALPGTIADIAKLAGKRLAAKQERPGTVTDADLRAFYLATLKKQGSFGRIKEREMKILANPMHGATAGYMQSLFAGTQVSVDEMNAAINPSFGGTNPEPIEENLSAQSSLMRRKKYDLGFAFDGDGDRISCFDEKGGFYSSQRLLPLFLNYLATVKKARGLVVKTVSTSSMLSVVAERNGIGIAEVPIGFKNIVPYFLDGKAILGGEESGGIAVRGYIPERDSLFCSLFLMEILAHYGKSLSAVWKEMEDTYGRFVFKREDYTFDDEGRVRKLLSGIDLDSVCGLKVTGRNFIDGRKFMMADRGFLLIRVSGTEPVVRVYAEAGDAGRLNDVFAWARKLLSEKGVNTARHI